MMSLASALFAVRSQIRSPEKLTPPILVVASSAGVRTHPTVLDEGGMKMLKKEIELAKQATHWGSDLFGFRAYDSTVYK